MTAIYPTSPAKTLTNQEMIQFCQQELGGELDRQRVLVLVPDQTRTLPLPRLFAAVVQALEGVAALDVMVALGTHPPLSRGQMDRLLGLTAVNRSFPLLEIRCFNHDYQRRADMIRVGEISPELIRTLAGDCWHPSLDQVLPITINRKIMEYDQLLILGPVFPHEVVGFSGGAKYLFPGISGSEMIDVTHWLGALVGVQKTIGRKNTPVRRMITEAASAVPVPVKYLAPVVVEEELAGLFYGDHLPTWERAAELSAEKHVLVSEQKYHQVLSQAPVMYDELWTAAKAMYKVESMVADGGTLILYAPHLDQISEAHGNYLKKIGYHVMPYFLQQWEQFAGVPLAVLAHSTHLKGAGTYRDGKEEPRIEVVLSTRIPEEVCRKLNLGYLDPEKVNPASWEGKEGEGRRYIPRAGETLYLDKACGQTD